jgi:hypothetical protein
MNRNQNKPVLRSLCIECTAAKVEAIRTISIRLMHENPEWTPMRVSLRAEMEWRKGRGINDARG